MAQERIYNLPSESSPIDETLEVMVDKNGRTKAGKVTVRQIREHSIATLADVSESNPQDGDVLVRSGGVWINATDVPQAKNADTLDNKHYSDISQEILSKSSSVLVLPFPSDDGQDYGASDIIQLVMDAVPISAYQFTDGATQRVVGRLRIEWGRDTLSTGQKVVTFQKAFREILEVFLQNKSATNPMYPTAVGTTGFTANGTGTDTFAWLAVGID